MVLNKCTKILIIDKNEADYLLVKQLINEIPNGNFEVDWCNNQENGLKFICEFSHDLYFLDFFEFGLHSMEMISNSKLCNPEAPKIILSTVASQEFILKALELGASDYLSKTNLTPDLLSRAIRYAIARFSANEALRNSEQKYRAVFEQTKTAIFLMDEDFVIFEVNSAMESLFRYSELEFKGKSISDLIAKKSQVESIKKMLLGKIQIVKFKADFNRSKLSSFAGEICIVPIHQLGDGDYFQGIIHDITKIKKDERSLLMLEKMEAANRLARTLAHEIRNPLTNINLSLDHLRYQNLEQAQQHFLDIILRNSKRINDILSDLLASSTPSKLTLIPNNLQDIVDESLAIALDRIMLKKIKLQVQYSDSPIEALSDFDQLKIAFLNIIINGIEAMEENIGKMIISIEESPNAWLVKISDNGSGISKENISRLFEPYFTAKRNGMGLGLTSSLNILKSHHAEVDVDSEVDKGTTFIVSFPKHHETENRLSNKFANFE